MSIAIKVENLSKIYRLGEIGTGTISRDLERWWTTKILKREDPFLKIGEANDRAHKGHSDIVYSLRDINLEINQGEAVGIIGKNGAGKSTLLKILSRVTSPTLGEVKIRGRIASLLEVGTGFHPELTGRENIYLNGAILGMRKKEIDKKLDEIIAFSGVERYIDTPVKRYSSGMYVRLAFAVAAHLESEILIVDEVLAVGDAEFQKKCLSKMGEVSKGEGRTVLFVTHNMGAVIGLCGRSILLENGLCQFDGLTSETIEHYLSHVKEASHCDLRLFSGARRGNRTFAEIISISILSMDYTPTTSIGMGDSFIIQLCIDFKQMTKNCVFGVLVRNSLGTLIHDFRSAFDGFNPEFEVGLADIEIIVPEIKLYPGTYTIGSWIQQQVGVASDDYINEALRINIIDKKKLGDLNAKFEIITKEGSEVYHKCYWKKKY